MSDGLVGLKLVATLRALVIVIRHDLLYFRVLPDRPVRAAVKQ